MQQILLFILLGLGSGALIAGIALAVVLCYRGSGIINLSTGAIAMLGGYAFWALNAGKLATLPTAVALPLSLLFVLAVGAITEFAVYRPLRNSSPLAKLVSSLGVLLIAQSAMLLAFGVTPQPEPGILPANVVHILGAVVPVNRFILAGLVIVAAAGLAALYKWTRFGLATRAAAENEAAAMLSGLSPNIISLTNTLLASLLAGGLGILAASITQLDPSTLPLQIIPALAAALIASFTSFGIAAGASFGIAIMYSLLQYASAQSWFPQSGGVSLPGVTDLLAFGIIVVVLFWRGSRIPGRGEIVERRLPEAPRPRHLVRTGLICGLAGAVLLIVFPFDFREALINTLIGALMALSLVVVTGFVGQISVVQLALAGAAGFTISHMAVNFGITFPVAALAGIVVAVVIGLITAVSAVRVRGVSLAVVTLAGAVAIENFGFVEQHLGRRPGRLAGARAEVVRARPRPAGTVPRNRRQPAEPGLRLGRAGLLRAVDDRGRIPPPRHARSADARGALQRAGGRRRGDQPADREAGRLRHRGVHRRPGRRAVRVQLRLGERRPVRRGDRAQPDRVRLRGRHHAHLRRGVRRPAVRAGADPVCARQLVRAERELVPAGRRRAADLHPAAEPGGRGRRHLPADAQAARDPRARGRRRSRSQHARSRAGHRARRGSSARAEPASRPVLRVTGLSVAFGGVHALRDVTLEVREGELVGLIGPNGAGKTTLVDAVSGFVGCTGRVELSGADIGGLPPYERARRGLGRTWQSTELFDDLDVRENLTVASRSERSAPPRRIGLVGMDWAAEAMPGQLSMGQRKLVGVARALAARPRLLCLDEPAAGLDTRESAELGARLRGLADQGQSMLLIEHDMGLVLSVCDRVIVLEFGQVIADGLPEVVRRDPRVLAAYLGGGVNMTSPLVEEQTE